MNQLNWRRGGAFGEQAELPNPETIIMVARTGYLGERIALEQRYFVERHGKWWRTVYFWCYESDLLATLPKEQP